MLSNQEGGGGDTNFLDLTNFQMFLSLSVVSYFDCTH